MGISSTAILYYGFPVDKYEYDEFIGKVSDFFCNFDSEAESIYNYIHDTLDKYKNKLRFNKVESKLEYLYRYNEVVCYLQYTEEFSYPLYNTKIDIIKNFDYEKANQDLKKICEILGFEYKEPSWNLIGDMDEI